jgi:hypothetical protein
LEKSRSVRGATFDSHSDGETAQRYDGTRVDVLTQIFAWSRSNKGQGILWLNGMAVTGKSTISRTAAYSLAETGVLAASLFFKQGEGDRGQAARIIHKLLSMAPYVQVALQLTQMPP